MLTEQFNRWMLTVCDAPGLLNLWRLNLANEIARLVKYKSLLVVFPRAGYNSLLRLCKPQE